MSRPNFFILLGLDPAAPWDQATYERALADSRNRWSRQLAGIKDDPATVEAKRNLALIRDLKGVLLDPAKREAERTAARAAQADERRRRRDLITERLDLMLAKGFLYDVERDALVTDGADAEQIRRADAAEIRPFGQARQDHRRLAPDTERTLKANLAIVQHRDLYQLLATADPLVTDTSPLERLTAAADALYGKARTIADKTLPEVGALQKLAGLARQVFDSAEQRRRHDFSMLVAPVEAVAEQYAAHLSPVRRVDARQFEVFLHTAAERGWDLTLAQDVFAGYLRGRGWTVETPSEPATQWLRDQRSCPDCASLNDPAAEHCTRCGARMRSPCPRCGNQPQVRAAACPHCGFPVGQRAWVHHLAEEAEAALARGDQDGAAAAVGDAQIGWPLGPDSDDELAVRLRTAAERVERLRHTERTSLAPITLLMDGGSYRTAMTQLRSLGVRSPASEAMLANCVAVVREADELCATARGSGLPPDRRAELYLRAVELCPDHREARRELLAIAPAPPRGLLVVVHEEKQRVSLTWEPAQDRGCSSVVVRADDPVPPVAATGPGLRRWLVRAGGSWEDEAPLVGLPMSYAVFTERDIGGTVSAQAAATTAPVLLTAPVTLTVRPGDATAELSWTLPDHATGVEIHREEVPSGAGHVRLTPPAAGLRQLTDTNLRNGERYRYTVYARYPYLVPGRPEDMRLSSGTVREVTPGPAPEPPGKVHARGHPPPPGISLYRHKVGLSWPPPAGPGLLRVIKTVPPARPLAPGTELDADELDKTGLDGRHQLLEHDDIWLADPAPCWYTPVLVSGGRCYVGESRPYAPGPEVTELTADYAGTAARLTWTWPDGVTEALVGWDQTAAPPDPLAATHQQPVGRAAYDRAGGYDLPGRSARELFIRVAAVIRTEDGEFVTSGADVHAVRQPVMLRYEVRRGRLGRRPELVLRPDRPASLPEFKLHWRADQCPAGRDDPHILVPPGRADGELVVPLSLARTTVVLSCRLLHADIADIADTGMITIVHPVTA
jgi:hypothetical protein